MKTRRNKLCVVLLSIITVSGCLTSCGTADNKDITNSAEDNSLIIERASEGLIFDLNYAETGYVLSGIGNCTDNDIVIPSTYNDLPVTEIGNYAFKDCEELTSVTIPNSVTWIGMQAFDGCTGFTSITIPDSVVWIGPEAFAMCGDLTSITLGSGLVWLDDPFYGTSCENLYVQSLSQWLMLERADAYSVPLFKKDSGYSVLYINNEIPTNVVIPSDITKIGFKSFYGCVNLISVTIPNSVTKIEDAAFMNCTSLTEVTIPDSVTEINVAAFSNCSNLRKATISNNLTTIGHSAFYQCTSLTDVIIPDSVTKIEGFAFGECTSLKDIVIPDSVVEIETAAFSECSDSMNIYCEAKAKPENWEDWLNGCDAEVYWGDEWEYVNGVPTLK